MIRSTFVALGITFPIHSFNDIIVFFQQSDSCKLELIFRNELIFNAIYAIWCEYVDIMAKMDTLKDDCNEFNDYMEKTKTTFFLTKYDYLNYKCHLILPHHVRAAENKFISHAQQNPDAPTPTQHALLQEFLFIDMNQRK